MTRHEVTILLPHPYIKYYLQNSEQPDIVWLMTSHHCWGQFLRGRCWRWNDGQLRCDSTVMWVMLQNAAEWQRTADDRTAAIWSHPAQKWSALKYNSSLRTMTTILLLLYWSALLHSRVSSSSQHHHQAPISLLRDLIIGEVIPCCGQRLAIKYDSQLINIWFDTFEDLLGMRVKDFVLILRYSIQNKTKRS